MPKSTPTIDAATPTSSASSMTVPTTWFPEAPTARSSPSCRVRCATVILKALKMMKLPTKRAIAAKASRKLRKMSTNEVNWSLSSCAATVPVTAS